MAMSEIQELQRWYAAQCNGDWEHSYGISIETLDNPGWRVRISLADTTLTDVAYVEVSDLAPEENWIRTWVDGDAFHGAGGPHMLGTILRRFLDWARTTGSEATHGSLS
jgi:hypothetical protein